MYAAPFANPVAENKAADHLWQNGIPQILQRTWTAYKRDYIQQDGRVVDHAADVVSTSEGQSYAMLRAVWMQDRTTFDQVYQWTRNNMQVRGDKLFAWKWGRRPDGTWRQLDDTSASDADQDIALALLMASQIWPEKDGASSPYQADALAILHDLWNKETHQTPFGRTLLPGDWAMQDKSLPGGIRINPSYFSPYEYRVFASVDRKHPWKKLIDSSYKIWEAITSQTLTKLPSDWVEVSLEDKKVTLFPPENIDGDYSYEAVRTPWRVGLDYMLVRALGENDPRAEVYLRKSDFLVQYFLIHKRLPGPLTRDGIERHQLDSDATYGCHLIQFALQDPKAADLLGREHILATLNSRGLWIPELNYYAQNWLWLGLLGYNAFLNQPEQPKAEHSLFSPEEQPLTALIRLMKEN
jgi:endoglucanase